MSFAKKTQARQSRTQVLETENFEPMGCWDLFRPPSLLPGLLFQKEGLGRIFFISWWARAYPFEKKNGQQEFVNPGQFFSARFFPRIFQSRWKRKNAFIFLEGLVSCGFFCKVIKEALGYIKFDPIGTEVSSGKTQVWMKVLFPLPPMGSPSLERTWGGNGKRGDSSTGLEVNRSFRTDQKSFKIRLCAFFCVRRERGK